MSIPPSSGRRGTGFPLRRLPDHNSHNREGMVMSSTDVDGEFRGEAERAAEQERKIQAGIDAKEARSFKSEDDDKPMQAGAREYPAPPFPKQHLEKPGDEVEMQLQPLWDAPFYKGSGKLEGKVA